MFDDWIATEGLEPLDRLRLIVRLLDIHPDLLPELQAIVFSATEPDGPEWDKDEWGHDLRNGMDELRRRRVPIPLALAEAFVRAKRPNLRYAGAAAIGAHATQEALDLLVTLYKTTRGDRSTIFGEMEVVAARLGVTIMAADLV